MAYLLIAVVAVALAAIAWNAWRRRRPLTLLRTILVALMLAGGGAAEWIVYEMRDLEQATDGAARAFQNAATHWH